MAVIHFVLFFGAILSVSSGQQGFEGVLSDSKPCEEACVKSYSPHTNPKGGDESKACSRGCRLYTISEFVNRDGGIGEKLIGPLKSPLESCAEACTEAYNETSDRTVACKFGCKSQEGKTHKDKEQSDDDESGPNIHLLSPLFRIRSVYSSVVGAVHVIRSSLVTFFSTDDNSVVAVESSPEIMVEVLGEEGEEMNRDEKSPLSPRLPSKPWLYSDDAISNSIAGGVRSDEPSVVKCVSDRLGVPPPLLVVSALILVFFTIYVIFTICTTATPPKKHKAGLSIQSEPLPVPIKLVRPEDLTRLSLMEEDDLQAPALPTKVKIPDTHV